jgi:hypothetical protein
MVLAYDDPDLAKIVYFFVMVIISTVLASVINTHLRRIKRRQRTEEIDPSDPMEVALGKLREPSEAQIEKRQATIEKVKQMTDQGLPVRICQNCDGLGWTTLGIKCAVCGGRGYVNTRVQ